MDASQDILLPLVSVLPVPCVIFPAHHPHFKLSCIPTTLIDILHTRPKSSDDEQLHTHP